MPKARREGSGKRRAKESVERDRAPAGRRHYERRRNDRRYRDLIVAAADWLWECDADGRVNFLSPEFDASTGFAAQSLLGKRLADLAAAEAGSTVQDEQRAAIAAAKPFRDLVFKLACADGPGAWLELAGAPIVEAGAFRGYCGLGKTVTARIESALALQCNGAPSCAGDAEFGKLISTPSSNSTTRTQSPLNGPNQQTKSSRPSNASARKPNEHYATNFRFT